jgi:hypothetical protein
MKEIPAVNVVWATGKADHTITNLTNIVPL